MENKQTKIVFLGLGGQGLLFTSRVLALASFLSGKFSTYIPSYGSEVHNGKVKAEVIISDTEIYNPFISKADYILLFDYFREEDAKDLIGENTILFCKDFVPDISNIKKDNVITVQTEEISEKFDNEKISNLVLLGTFIKYSNIIEDKAIGESLKNLLIDTHYNMIFLNFDAYKKGKELIKIK